ncbi:MAG TPA: glycosyltransferase [Acidimicrobiia bacterium]|nr:glycosyltransferase [Acidimicrobiia bacterium]
MPAPVVLVLIKGLGIGGAERLISEGARFWDRQAFDYRVAYLLPWKDQLVSDLEALDVPVRCLGGGHGLGPSSGLRLRRHVLDSGASLIHAHLPSAGIIARTASPVPVVYTEHNLAHSYRAVTRIVNRLTYGRNRAVTAVSEAVAETVSRYPGPPVEVVPNGVTVSMVPARPAAVRTELGLRPDQPLVVHVGNIRPGKGHDLLIEAAELLAVTQPDAVVVSIGGEKYPGDMDRLRDGIVSRGLDERVRFLGRRRDALAFIAAADVYVNPAAVEGLPVTILEALALSRPVVATAVGGVPSVIVNEKTGLLVTPGDAEGLAAGIGRLLTDHRLAAELAAAGSDLVDREYGLERMIRTYEDIYRRVLR